MDCWQWIVAEWMILLASHDFFVQSSHIYSIIPQLKVFELKSLIKCKSNAMVFGGCTQGLVHKQWWHVCYLTWWLSATLLIMHRCVFQSARKKRHILTLAIFLFIFFQISVSRSERRTRFSMLYAFMVIEIPQSKSSVCLTGCKITDILIYAGRPTAKLLWGRNPN